jgi:MFS family permease
LGFLNYVLEIAPTGQRPVYIGLTNTLAGIIILYPFIGGALTEWTGYRIVFLLAAAGVVAGWITGASLPARSDHPAAGKSAADETQTAV